MKNKELEKFIRDTANSQIETDEFWDELCQFLDLGLNSKLFDKMFSPIEKAVDYIDSELVKYNAKDNWMAYFVYECNCGDCDTPYTVTTQNGEKEYFMTDVDAFINFLEIEYGV